MHRTNPSFIYLIDLGLSCRISSTVTTSQPELIGTAIYASKNAHYGHKLSRADDLESLGYTLVYLSKGRLPWSNIPLTDKEKRGEKILKLKHQIVPAKLCSGLDDSFTRFFEYVSSLAPSDIPDYGYLRKLFECAGNPAIMKLANSEKFNKESIPTIAYEECTESDERYAVSVPYIGKYKENVLAVIGSANILRDESDHYDSLYTFHKL